MHSFLPPHTRALIREVVSTGVFGMSVAVLAGSPVAVSAPLQSRLPPSGAHWPTDPKECSALQQEWSAYFAEYQRLHQDCLDSHGEKRPTPHANVCSVGSCQGLHDYLYGSYGDHLKARQQAQVDSCHAAVAEHRKQLAAERTAEDEKKRESQRQESAVAPVRERDSEREGDSERDRQALDRATESSRLAHEALVERTEDRRRERTQLAAARAAANDQYQAETRGLLSRLGATVSQAFRGVPNADPSMTVGGTSLQDLDLSSLSGALPTIRNDAITALDSVAQLLAPFAATPLSFSNWILTENLETLDQLSRVLAHLDTATPADVDRIWNDYQTRVWSPEEWLKKLAVETTVNAFEQYGLGRLESPTGGHRSATVQSSSESASGPPSRFALPPTTGLSNLYPAPVGPASVASEVSDQPRWWVKRATRTSGPDLERDAEGIPLLRDSSGRVFGYDRSRHRVDYNRDELEQLVASGELQVFKSSATESEWTQHNVLFLPVAPPPPAATPVRPGYSSVFGGDASLDVFPYSAIESGFGEALSRLADNHSRLDEKKTDAPDGSRPNRIAEWFRTVTREIDAQLGVANDSLP